MKREEADKILDGYQSLPLGKIIKITEEEKIYPEPLQKELRDLLKERNWLVHKCLFHNKGGANIYPFQDNAHRDISLGKLALFNRIKNISNQIHKIMVEVDNDFIERAELKGMNMSKIKAAMKARSK